MKVLMAVEEIAKKTDSLNISLNTVTPDGKRSFKGYAVITVPVDEAPYWKFGTLYEFDIVDAGVFVAPPEESK
jgi:hypothetical protein